jgi:hypothetical protein
MVCKEIRANGKLFWNNISIIILIGLLPIDKNPEE